MSGLIERRRHRRWAVAVDGSFRISPSESYPCRAEDVSPGGLCVAAPVAVTPGTRLVLDFAPLGRLVGFATRSAGRKFGVALLALTDERESLTARLTWLINSQVLGLRDARQATRFVPRSGATRLRLGDGPAQTARIVDLSRHGALVATRLPLKLGATLAIEDRAATVVRTLPGAVGIAFDEPLTDTHLADRLERPSVAVERPGFLSPLRGA